MLQTFSLYSLVISIEIDDVNIVYRASPMAVYPAESIHFV